MLPPIQTLNRLSVEFPLAKTFTRAFWGDSSSTSFSRRSFNCRIDDEPPESYPEYKFAGVRVLLTNYNRRIEDYVIRVLSLSPYMGVCREK
uniref:Uncharacterized protein n=1 Tax=Aegilops tauschii subsp. strangulata TaxID=200361 RepID=A0A453LL56_AEGTS